MVKEGMESLDVEHKGYITREEYVGKLARHVGVEHATAVYNAMDTDSKGKVIWFILIARWSFTARSIPGVAVCISKCI